MGEKHAEEKRNSQSGGNVSVTEVGVATGVSACVAADSHPKMKRPVILLI